LELRLRNHSIKEISEELGCRVQQVYDANDRIKRKLKAVKKSLDKKLQI